MKQKLLLLAIILPLFTFAQSSSTGILYTYDASGNRIKRELAPDIVGRKANPNAGTEEPALSKAEVQKETATVIEKNISASFTPNPTGTGNFAVLVQKTERGNFISQPHDVNDNMAFVSVFNALGELIQYNTTQLDKPLNIDLSALSKGVYLVKVHVLSGVEGQNGEDVILHRMAYQ